MHRATSKVFNIQRGSAYLVVMFAVVVMSISITAAAKQWKTVVQREKEADLLARGIEIQNAIGAYYTAKQPVGRGPQNLALARPPSYPLTLEQLTKGPKPFLRKIYKDPMTGQDWIYVRDPATGGIRGVRSRAKTAPIKQQEFPQAVFHFAGLKRYHDWVFQYPTGSTPQNPRALPGQQNPLGFPAQQSPLGFPAQQNPLEPTAKQTQEEGRDTSSAPVEPTTESKPDQMPAVQGTDPPK